MGHVHDESAVALQDRYAPANRCFGCGPANAEGLRLKSHVAPRAAAGSGLATDAATDAVDELVADFRPAPHHLAFEGIVNGGILGALLDCHSNWVACYTLMKARGLDVPPCTVTSDFAVKLKRPTPIDAVLHLRGKAVEVDGDKVVVDATIEANGKITATCHGTFVAVKEGHPAYHRW